MTTRLLIHIEVQDGERTHDHKVLHTTNCCNIDFAVEWYVAHYWGFGERVFEDEWWWWVDFAGRLSEYYVLTEDEYELLNKFI